MAIRINPYFLLSNKRLNDGFAMDVFEKILFKCLS